MQDEVNNVSFIELPLPVGVSVSVYVAIASLVTGNLYIGTLTIKRPGTPTNPSEKNIRVRVQIFKLLAKISNARVNISTTSFG